MTSLNPDPRRRRSLIGVDTHKHIHVAVALDVVGGRLDDGSFAADPVAVRRRDVGVVEVLRTDRRDRRLQGKSDTPDAENAARAGLAGTPTRSRDGTVEMLRQITIVTDTTNEVPIPGRLRTRPPETLAGVSTGLAARARCAA